MLKILRVFSLVIILVMLINYLPLHALASTYSDKSISLPDIDPEYLAEMEELGFTKENVSELNELNQKIASAKTKGEFVSLMARHDDMLNGAIFNSVSSDNSFYTPSGGTLVLDYLGESDPVNQVIIDKIVYLPTEQVLYYSLAMNSEGFLDFVKDELIAAGVSIVTSHVVVIIAETLGVSASSLSWMVGTTLGIMVWMLQNMDKWAFEDAIEACTGDEPKVKIIFYHSISAFYPYYANYTAYEPLNNSIVEPPEDYDYAWYADVYEYDSSAIHNHSLVYTFNGNGTHTIACSTCTEVTSDTCNLVCTSNGSGEHTYSCDSCSNTHTENCDLKYTNITNTRHSVACTVCDYSISRQSCTVTYTSKGNKTHTATCSKCKNTYTGSCSIYYSYLSNNQHRGSCNKCNYSYTQACDIAYTYSGDGATSHVHERECQICGNGATAASEACDLAYKAVGDNTHVQACQQCQYITLGPVACSFNVNDICWFCGARKDAVILNEQEEDVLGS